MLSETDHPNRSFPPSLSHLARLGLRHAKAAGFAIDQLDASSNTWLRKCAEGLAVPGEGASELGVLRYSLGTEVTTIGALFFVFDGTTVPHESEPQLAKIALASQALWRVWHVRSSYLESIARIANLEAEIADSKVSDRACALLESSCEQEDPVESISRSVAAIVGPYQLGRVLRKLVQDLESDMAEYKLVKRAKGTLQQSKGMTETQAYLHLRLLSRQTRRPMRNIASELIEFGLVPGRIGSQNTALGTGSRFANDRYSKPTRPNQS